MSMTDPIADLLTRIRNGSAANHQRVRLPSSRLKRSIVEVLKNEGFIDGYRMTEIDGRAGEIEIDLRYVDREPTIKSVKRISKPGHRSYVGYDSIPRVLNGMGLAILSTPKGVLSDREARKQKVGGELLCTVF